MPNDSSTLTKAPLLLSPQLNARTDKMLWDELRSLNGRRLELSNSDHAVWVRRWNQIKRAVQASTGLKDGSALNTRTDEAFWKELRSKVGRRLDPSANSDALYRERWREIRRRLFDENPINAPLDAVSPGILSKKAPLPINDFSGTSKPLISVQTPAVTDEKEDKGTIVDRVWNSTIGRVTEANSKQRAHTKVAGVLEEAKNDPNFDAAKAKAVGDFFHDIFTIVNFTSELAGTASFGFTAFAGLTTLSIPLTGGLTSGFAAAVVPPSTLIAAKFGLASVGLKAGALAAEHQSARYLTMATVGNSEAQAKRVEAYTKLYQDTNREAAFGALSLILNARTVLGGIGGARADFLKEADKLASFKPDASLATRLLHNSSGWQAWLSQRAPASVGAIAEAVDWVKGFVDAWQTVVKFAANLAEAWKAVKGVLTFGWDKTKEGASAVWQGSKNLASLGWEGTKTGLNWTQEKATAGWSWSQQKASQGWNWTQEKARAGLSWGQEKASQSWNWTKGSALVLKGRVTDGVAGGVNWMTQNRVWIGDALTQSSDTFAAIALASTTLALAAGATGIGLPAVPALGLVAASFGAASVATKSLSTAVKSFGLLDGSVSKEEIEKENFWNTVDIALMGVGALAEKGLKLGRAVAGPNAIGAKVWAKAEALNKWSDKLRIFTPLTQNPALFGRLRWWGRALTTSNYIKDALGIFQAYGPGLAKNSEKMMARYPELARDGGVTGPFFPSSFVGPQQPQGTAAAMRALGGGAAIYVNGVATNLETHIRAAQKIADVEGVTVVGVYNATAGKGRDFLQCIGDKTGLDGVWDQNPATVTLVNLIQQFGNPKVKNGGLHIYGHSQGTIIISEALRQAKKRGTNLGNIDVTAYASAAWTMPTGVRSHEAFAYDSDFIPGTVGATSGVGQMMARSTIGQWLMKRAGLSSTLSDVAVLHHEGGFDRPHAVVRDFVKARPGQKGDKEGFALDERGHRIEDNFSSYIEDTKKFREQRRATQPLHGQNYEDHLVERSQSAWKFAMLRSGASKIADLVGSGYNALDKKVPGKLRSLPFGLGPLGVPSALNWNTIDLGLRAGGNMVLRGGAGLGHAWDRMFSAPDKAVLQRSTPLGGDAAINAMMDAGGLRNSLLSQSLGFAPDANIRGQLAPHLGFDPAGARFHTSPVAAAAARSLQAEAFTIGSDVFFGANRFAPASRAGLGLIAHELTHVGQQIGVTGNKTQFLAPGSGDRLEREAQGIGRNVQNSAMRQLTGTLLADGPRVENFEREYVCDDGLSEADRARLDGLSGRALSGAMTRLGGLDSSLVLEEVACNVSLSLDDEDDEHLVAQWTEALVAAVREASLRTQTIGSLKSLSPLAAESQVQRSAEKGKDDSRSWFERSLTELKTGVEWVKFGKDVHDGIETGHKVGNWIKNKGQKMFAPAMKKLQTSFAHLRKTITKATNPLASHVTQKVRAAFTDARKAIGKVTNPKYLRGLVPGKVRDVVRHAMDATRKQANSLWKQASKKFKAQVKKVRSLKKSFERRTRQMFKSGAARLRRMKKMLPWRNKLGALSKFLGKTGAVLGSGGKSVFNVLRSGGKSVFNVLRNGGKSVFNTAKGWVGSARALMGKAGAALRRGGKSVFSTANGWAGSARALMGRAGSALRRGGKGLLNMGKKLTGPARALMGKLVPQLSKLGPRLSKLMPQIGKLMSHLGKGGGKMASRFKNIPHLGKILSLTSVVLDFMKAKPEDRLKVLMTSGISELGSWAGGAAGGYAGATSGAAIGGAIGALFGGVGAVPGAAIGAIIGGLLGTLAGSEVGGAIGKGVGQGAYSGLFEDKPQKSSEEEESGFLPQPPVKMVMEKYQPLKEYKSKKEGEIGDKVDPYLRPYGPSVREALFQTYEFGEKAWDTTKSAWNKTRTFGEDAWDGANEAIDQGRDWMKRNFAPDKKSEADFPDYTWPSGKKSGVDFPDYAFPPDAERGWA